MNLVMPRRNQFSKTNARERDVKRYAARSDRESRHVSWPDEEVSEERPTGTGRIDFLAARDGGSCDRQNAVA